MRPVFANSDSLDFLSFWVLIGALALIWIGVSLHRLVKLLTVRPPGE